MENSKFVPPQPVWQCFKCDYELYEKSTNNPDGIPANEPGPKECPKCGSTAVHNMHLVIMEDPPRP